MGKVIDLTGQRFGRLVVIGRSGTDKFKYATWKCLCDCGKETSANGSLLRRGKIKSCGCLRKEVDNLTGQQFGRLIVLKQAPNIGIHTAWLCQCDCGEKTVVSASNLKIGNTKSCGCFGKELTVSGQRTKKHKGTGTRLYRIWNGMRHRCYNVKQGNYKYYGERGISICDEWINDFGVFQNWAYSHGYQDDLTIDRIDPNGPYAPWNCKWSTMKEQRINQRRNKKSNQ